MNGKSGSTASSQIYSYWLKIISGRHADLRFIIMFSILTDVFIFLPSISSTVLRSIISLVFVFSIPGYALLVALFPKNDNVTNIERVLISVGMSIVIVTLACIFLNYTVYGIYLVPLTTLLSVFVLVNVAIAYLRRRSLAAEEGNSALIPKIIALGAQLFPHLDSKLNKLFTAAFIVLVVIAGSTLTFLIFTPHQAQGFTEFYIVGPRNELDEYPTQLALGQTQRVQVNITNHEGQDMTYKLVVLLNDTKNSTVLYEKNVSVGDNTAWHEELSLKPNHTGSNLREEFLIYTDNDFTTPYRELHLWVNVTK